ncbi:hypothetical protein KSP39_PZI017894 [Platanthera zijinensis]|uniref:Endonuclease/exonuclease/phosphatase domain-containing protein n=1 Tax=Platanthera zijinensis TaxID=2320716 RepID=A0AAP0FZQ8_9ASPA
MPLLSRSLFYIGAATQIGIFKAAMPSSSFGARGRNHWPRGFCDRAYEALNGVDAFMTGDSYQARGASYQARGAYPQQFQRWNPLQPGLPPKSADHRNWILATSPPPRELERFKVLSYNILADYLALDHQSNLYFHIPNHILAWEWRKRRLFIEFGLWSPDIMCLQEVDRFSDLEGELSIRGYTGIWKMRTGNAVDGCAIFWRTNRFQLRHAEHIEFCKLGLRDNVAQICVLESKTPYMAENVSAALPTSYGQSTGANQVVVCNTHLLYNPKRGEIKLGQVRVLLDRAYTVSKDWNDAPVIVCGDFNSTPMSPLYKFIATQKLNLLGLARDQVSGQYSATVHIRPNYGFSSYSRRDSGSAFGTQEGYYRPNNQHYMENSFADGSFTGRMGSHCQLKTDRQMSFGATAIKLGEVEIFSNQSGEISSAHSKLANIPSRTSEISSQQSVIHVNRESDKNGELGNNREEPQKNSFGRPCFEDHKDSTGSGDLAGGIKFNSLSCIDNSTVSLLPETVNFHDVQKDSNHVGNTSSFHRNRDLSAVVFCDSLSSDATDLNKILHIDGADDTLSKERPSTSYASLEIPSIDSAVTERADPLVTCFYSGKDDGLNAFRFYGSHVSDSVVVISSVKDEKVMEKMNSGEDRKNVSSEKILQKMPTICCNLSSDATSAENRRLTELSCLEENGDSQSLELSGLEGNADPNFLKELLGMEDENQIIKDFNSSELSLHLSSTALDKARCLYNPYCWSPEEMEIASGKQNCTIVEHSLKLRSVYRDVEDYTGTKDSNREPQVTSYNQQFIGTVDYIWCSKDLLTAGVLDTIPKHVLQRTRGFPTQKWGSDHIALACELAFVQKN